MRKLTLDHRAAPAIGRLVLDIVRDLDVDAVGGLTLGADPIANAVLHASVAAGTPVDAFVVRKEPKDHGRGRQIEGAEVAGKRVVIVEDTSTTGGSPLKAAEVVAAAGAEVVAVVTVVDRKTGAQAAVEALGYEWRSVIDLDDLGLMTAASRAPATAAQRKIGSWDASASIRPRNVRMTSARPLGSGVP